MNVFITSITETNSEDGSENLEETYDSELTLEEHKVLWKEDSEARAIQKENIQDLMEENDRLMSIISTLKQKLREVHNEYNQIMKSVKMLNSGFENLDLILSSGKTNSDKFGLSFDSSVRNINPATEIKFISASSNDKSVPSTVSKIVSPSVKTTKWVCHYCG